MSTDPPTCTLCRPDRTCPWHTPEAIAFTQNQWDDWDDDPDNWPEDYNGLQISAMRYANYVKGRQACSTLTR